MAKRKYKSQSGKSALLLAIFLGLLSTVTIFLPAIKGVGNLLGTEESYTGLQVAFGHKETSEGIIAITREVLKANVFSILAYGLPLVSILLLILFGGARFFDFFAFFSQFSRKMRALWHAF